MKKIIIDFELYFSSEKIFFSNAFKAGFYSNIFETFRFQFEHSFKALKIFRIFLIFFLSIKNFLSKYLTLQ